MTYAEKAVLKLIRNAITTVPHPSAKLALQDIATKIEQGRHLEAEVLPARSARDTVRIEPTL